jgi:hypothetical protein
MLNATCKFMALALVSLWLAPGAMAAEKPVLNDWFALGSGCRAKSNLPGNVKMELVDEELKSDLYKAKFHFSEFSLQTADSNRYLKKFGRECAVRLNINPPQGKRLVGIRAITKVLASKETGPALDILSELKLGSESLGTVQRKLADSATVKGAEEVVDLRAGLGSGEPLPQVGCAEPKIIGFDYSWIATQENGSNGNLKVALGKDNELVIEAKLEDCAKEK